MTAPKCLALVSTYDVTKDSGEGDEEMTVYRVEDVHHSVIPLEAKVAALRAEVARLTTWVAVDYTQGQLFGVHPFVLWTAPCNALLRRDETHSELDMQVVAKGYQRWLDTSKRAIYLPFTPPEEPPR